MNQKQKKSTKTILGLKMMLMIGFGLTVFSNSLRAVDFTVVKDPKPTFKEKNFVTLVKANQICDSDDEREFIAFPRAMTVDHSGNLYVFDTAQVKILKYDRALKFVKSYGQSGRGPGDFLVTSRGTRVGMVCHDAKLYVFIANHQQLVVMDLDLNYIDEFRLNLRERVINRDFAVSKAGDFVFYSSEGKGKMLVLDSKMKLKSTFSIDLKLFDFLFFTPPECIVENKHNDCQLGIKHGISKDSELAVYSPDTSTLFIFNNNRLENRFNLYSRKILDEFKPALAQTLKDVSKYLKKRKGYICGYRAIFANFLIDNDTGKSFYLEYRDMKNKKIYLYNFDFKGKLLKVYQFEDQDIFLNRTAFKIKRNHLFFAVANSSEIVTYKERPQGKITAAILRCPWARRAVPLQRYGRDF